MTQSALVKALENARKDGILVSLPVLDSTKIFKGAVTLVKAPGSTGYVYTSDGTTNNLAVGDAFAGISKESADNTVTGHANGFVSVGVYTAGEFLLPFTDNLAAAALFAPVYCTTDSLDSAVSITAVSGGTKHQVIVGVITKVVTTGSGTSTAYVRIDNAVGNLVTTPS